MRNYIERCQENWRNGGPLRAFGVFDCATNQLLGSVEANLAYVLEVGQVNVSFGIFLQWRRRGLGGRALDLMDQYLGSATDVRQIVLRIAPANSASRRVAEKAGFTFLGIVDEPKGRFARYSRDVQR